MRDGGARLRRPRPHGALLSGAAGRRAGRPAARAASGSAGPSATARRRPRNGLVSGCYPLDPFYKDRPERLTLTAINCARGTAMGYGRTVGVMGRPDGDGDRGAGARARLPRPRVEPDARGGGTVLGRRRRLGDNPLAECDRVVISLFSSEVVEQVLGRMNTSLREGRILMTRRRARPGASRWGGGWRRLAWSTSTRRSPARASRRGGRGHGRSAASAAALESLTTSRRCRVRRSATSASVAARRR